ncbi:hypothetical protein [Paenibacillus sp. 22594]|uniref:hypothetical protein n=1 Tax=Paenibacillus sp. 22594 TaxID=3453947 RepID=UPI003F855E9E
MYLALSHAGWLDLPSNIPVKDVLVFSISFRRYKIQQLTTTMPAYYGIFDILMYKGQDLTGLLLLRRKEILAGLSLPSGSYGIMTNINRAGEALFEQIVERGKINQADSFLVNRREVFIMFDYFLAMIFNNRVRLRRIKENTVLLLFLKDFNSDYSYQQNRVTAIFEFSSLVYYSDYPS